jgi:hypothetical protein
MTWYTGMCGIMAMGILYELAFVINECVCEGFGSNGFVTKMQPFPMMVTIGQMSLAVWAT